MNDSTPSIQERLEQVFESILSPVTGCWPLHGAYFEHYFDNNTESHVLEAWPVGVEEVDEHKGNGHHRTDKGLLYELAEFDFLSVAEDVPVEHFHFSQAQSLFEIGWQEGDNSLELRIHILPKEGLEDACPLLFGSSSEVVQSMRSSISPSLRFVRNHSADSLILQDGGPSEKRLWLLC